MANLDVITRDELAQILKPYEDNIAALKERLAVLEGTSTAPVPPAPPIVPLDPVPPPAGPPPVVPPSTPPGNPPAPPSAPAGKSPVTLAWAGPPEGATLAGVQRVSFTGQNFVNVEVFDDRGVRLETCVVDPAGTSAYADIDTTRLPDGNARLSAHAWNSKQGMPATSDAGSGTRGFVVKNGTSAPPPAGPPVVIAPSDVPQTIRSPLGHNLSLAFNDEFDGVPEPAGNGGKYFDRTKWRSTFWQGSGARTLAGNGEAQYYMDLDYGGAGNIPVEKRPNPFFFDKPSILTIKAFPVDKALWGNYWMGDARHICSGLLITDGPFLMPYGYAEIRCRMAAGKGTWPAFWFLRDTSGGSCLDPNSGACAAAHGWPPEIDVFEFFGHRPTKHSAGSIGVNGWFQYNDVGIDLTKDFHTYGMEWDRSDTVLTFDGKPWKTAKTGSDWQNSAFYMLLNLACGGNWYAQETGAAGPADVDYGSMPWEYDIDYVRAYA